MDSTPSSNNSNSSPPPPPQPRTPPPPAPLVLGLTPYTILMIVLLVIVLACCSLCVGIFLRRTSAQFFPNPNSNSFLPRSANAPLPPTPSSSPGLDPSTLSTFPLVRLSSLPKHLDTHLCSECAICLSEFGSESVGGGGVGGLLVLQLPRCKHVFHPACISTWFQSHTTCPICRRNLGPPPPNMFLTRQSSSSLHSASQRLVEIPVTRVQPHQQQSPRL